jgi:predicted XRE-type DNA-binding protein
LAIIVLPSPDREFVSRWRVDIPVKRHQAAAVVRTVWIIRTTKTTGKPSPMKIRQFENVWDALEDTPTDAAIMTMRSHLMFAIEETIKEWKVTKATAAKRLGLTQPRVTALLRRRISEFSLDELLNLAAKAGLKLQVEIIPASSPPFARKKQFTTPNP